MKTLFKLPIKPFDSLRRGCHGQFAKLIDYFLFKLKFDVLEQAVQRMELMEKVEMERETLTGEMEGIQGENRESMKRRLPAPRRSKYDSNKKDREWSSFMNKGGFPTFKAPERQGGNTLIIQMFVEGSLYDKHCAESRGAGWVGGWEGDREESTIFDLVW